MHPACNSGFGRREPSPARRSGSRVLPAGVVVELDGHLLARAQRNQRGTCECLVKGVRALEGAHGHFQRGKAALGEHKGVHGGACGACGPREGRRASRSDASQERTTWVLPSMLTRASSPKSSWAWRFAGLPAEKVLEACDWRCSPGGRRPRRPPMRDSPGSSSSALSRHAPERPQPGWTRCPWWRHRWKIARGVGDRREGLPPQLDRDAVEIGSRLVLDGGRPDGRRRPAPGVPAKGRMSRIELEGSHGVVSCGSSDSPLARSMNIGHLCNRWFASSEIVLQSFQRTCEQVN